MIGKELAESRTGWEQLKLMGDIFIKNQGPDVKELVVQRNGGTTLTTACTCPCTCGGKEKDKSQQKTTNNGIKFNPETLMKEYARRTHEINKNNENKVNLEICILKRDLAKAKQDNEKLTNVMKNIKTEINQKFENKLKKMSVELTSRQNTIDNLKEDLLKTKSFINNTSDLTGQVSKIEKLIAEKCPNLPLSSLSENDERTDTQNDHNIDIDIYRDNKILYQNIEKILQTSQKFYQDKKHLVIEKKDLIKENKSLKRTAENTQYELVKLSTDTSKKILNLETINKDIKYELDKFKNKLSSRESKFIILKDKLEKSENRAECINRNIVVVEKVARENFTKIEDLEKGKIYLERKNVDLEAQMKKISQINVEKINDNYELKKKYKSLEKEFENYRKVHGPSTFRTILLDPINTDNYVLISSEKNACSSNSVSETFSEFSADESNETDHDKDDQIESMTCKITSTLKITAPVFVPRQDIEYPSLQSLDKMEKLNKDKKTPNNRKKTRKKGTKKLKRGPRYRKISLAELQNCI